jgi:hypothetical protein
MAAAKANGGFVGYLTSRTTVTWFILSSLVVVGLYLFEPAWKTRILWHVLALIVSLLPRSIFRWVGGVSVLVIALLYYERADVLYILSTVGVAVLLIMVAKADLSGAKKEPASGPNDLNPAN